MQSGQIDEPDSRQSKYGNEVSPLVGFALAGLAKCWLPEFGRWSHSVHLDKQDNANESYPPSDVFYSLNVLLGLSRVRHVVPDSDLDTIFQRAVQQLETLPVRTYAYGMALWTAAELGFRLPPAVLERIRRPLLDRPQWRQFRAQDLGMLLCGVVGQAKHDQASWGHIADELFGFLSDQFLSDSGLFADQPNGPRWRFGTFASQVYLTLACYHYGEFAGESQALELADRCASKLIGLQGPHGEWPWLFDVQRGTVADFYEIYSVHQYGMAPAFLEIAQRRNVPGSRAALIKGFKWALGENLLGECMFDREKGLTIRSHIRRGERNTKVFRILRAFAHSILGWEARLIAPTRTELRRECRSYELGWLLWSFGKTTDLPELTAHKIFMASGGRQNRSLRPCPAQSLP